MWAMIQESYPITGKSLLIDVLLFLDVYYIVISQNVLNVEFLNFFLK